MADTHPPDFALYISNAVERDNSAIALAEQLTSAAIRRGHVQSDLPAHANYLIQVCDRDEPMPAEPSYFVVYSVYALIEPRTPPEWRSAWHVVGHSREVGVGDTGKLQWMFEGFLDELEDSLRRGVEVQLGAAIEAFVGAWKDIEAELPLSADDKRTADALVHTATELAKVDDPPQSVLRAVFDWFAGKADHFATEFVGAAGKATGTAAGVGMGATVSGQLPNLVRAIERVQQFLS